MRNGKYDVLSPLYSGEPVNEAEVLGAAVWLWMHSPLHRDAPLHTLPDLLLPVIKHRQYVVATEQGRPVFFMSQAWLSPEAEARYLTQPAILMPQSDWNSGDRMWVCDWVAPFGHTPDTGRIYGDAVGVSAATFNNLEENGVAATLAGRERVDLGVQTLNNRTHSLIYSAGDMHTGGMLDANGAATGKAGVLNNHSATIEAAGYLVLSAGQINNVNDHFTTERVVVSTEKVTEYQLSGSDKRWSAGEPGVYVDNDSSNSLKKLHTPEGARDKFTQYDYTRTVEETRVKESDPGKILSGAGMTIVADKLLNDKSQVVAGGLLDMQAGDVENVSVSGERHVTDSGTSTYYYRIRKKGKDKQGEKTSQYTPPTVIQTITLKPGELTSHGQVQGSQVTLSPLKPQGTDVQTGLTGNVDATVAVTDRIPLRPVVSAGEPVILLPGQQFEVSAPQGSIHVAGPDTRLPDSSLFKTNPAVNVPYLVETDPRFTNQKTWLGSDYMQKAFSQNGDNMLKRLGDGFYEQRLIREQVVALTGQRYLDGYSNDEEQFKALMDAGIAFGKQYNLTPGVALTAEQMALLTGDIVWLVNTTVTLPDGSTQTVQVPQVYARVKPGDVNSAGALIAGRDMVMKLDGDLFNSGKLAGKQTVQLSAENIHNQAGTIQGANVSLTARTDISSTGGLLQATDSLLAMAGRDINLTTTTRTAQSDAGQNHFERTSIDSVAGVYVQNDQGRLVLQAGRDMNLTAATVVNQGKDSLTQLSAGRDMTLSTVTTSAQDNITWDKNNRLSQGVTQSTGSTLAGNGDVTLTAGRDMTSQAASLSAQKGLALMAGHDVTLTGAQNTSSLDEYHKVTGSSGMLSKTTTTTHDVTDRRTMTGSELNGDTVSTTHTETTVDAGNRLTIISGRDTTLTGAQAGGETVKVDAGRHLTLTSEQDSDRYDSKQQNASAGGSFTFGSMSGSASVNLSRDKMHSNYDSVQEQTGIFAGRGGFDVTTGQHTQLNGAVIASTATADKNRLDTGTLGFSDIENRADFKTEHQSAGLSTGGSVAGNFLGNMANNLLVGANHEGHADSTTQSAVSAGNITIRDTQSQKQDVADLKRDAAHANQTLSPIFDREKEQQRLQQAQLIGEIGNQVADIARTEGQIAGEKAKRDPAALNQARAELEAAGKPYTEQDVAQRAYNNGMAASGFGTGGKYQQAIQAATAAVQGLAGGNLSAALAGGAAPYLAEVVKTMTTDPVTGEVNKAANVAAHAVVNAALAVAQGNNALAGAAGAATGEVVGIIATQMYGKPVSELSETEKQTVSTLATVAAGLAGGLVGDSGASAVAGAQSGKTTVENNFLGATSSDKLDKAIEKIRNGDKTLATANELIKLENADKRSDALVSKFNKDPSQLNSAERAELAAYLRVYASEMEKEYGTAVAQELVTGLLSGQDYIKRNPDTEAMAKAQSIMNTWGYHKSNASIGDAPLLFGGSVLGLTVKGMATNAAIGISVNSVAQLAGKDPFSYVDAIMAGVTAAATTGKGIIVSTPINMGGAAISSSIKGEDPTNSVIGAGAGSIFGGGIGKIATEQLKPVIKEGSAEVIGAVTGAVSGEVTGNQVKDKLDKVGNKNGSN
ncbi:TPA: toxin-activating lysine-acyltransferase [Escherichia coli]|nr:toxin-activating lysine-acyltransferase [Escherichia coli]